METHTHQFKSTGIMRVVLNNSLHWVPLPLAFIHMKQKMNCSCQSAGWPTGDYTAFLHMCWH